MPQREKITKGSGVRMTLTPPARASRLSPARRLWQARCTATSEDEQAVSTAIAGPLQAQHVGDATGRRVVGVPGRHVDVERLGPRRLHQIGVVAGGDTEEDAGRAAGEPVRRLPRPLERLPRAPRARGDAAGRAWWPRAARCRRSVASNRSIPSSRPAECTSGWSAAAGRSCGARRHPTGRRATSLIASTPSRSKVQNASGSPYRPGNATADPTIAIGSVRRRSLVELGLHLLDGVERLLEQRPPTVGSPARLLIGSVRASRPGSTASSSSVSRPVGASATGVTVAATRARRRRRLQGRAKHLVDQVPGQGRHRRIVEGQGRRQTLATAASSRVFSRPPSASPSPCRTGPCSMSTRCGSRPSTARGLVPNVREHQVASHSVGTPPGAPAARPARGRDAAVTAIGRARSSLSRGRGRFTS